MHHPAIDPENKFFELDENFARIEDKSLVLLDWKDLESDQRIVIFGTRELFEQLSQAKLWMIDGTFKSCPKPFTQLITVFGNNVANDLYTCYGMLNVMLTGKSIRVYQQMFKMISDLANAFNCNIVLEILLSDFQTAIGTAATSQFPHILTFFCFFHFAQSVVKRIGILGLKAELKDINNRKWLNLILALPMLPPSMISVAFDKICQQEIPTKLHPFIHPLVRRKLHQRRICDGYVVGEFPVD